MQHDAGVILLHSMIFLKLLATEDLRVETLLYWQCSLL